MKSIKIEDDLYDQIADQALRSNRSLGAQAEIWLALGRAIDRSPDFSQDHVDLALAGGIEVGELSLEEQEKFFQDFGQAMEQPGPTADFYAKRRAAGLGVGQTEDGRLIRQTAGGGFEPYQ